MSHREIPFVVSLDTEEDNWVVTRESITTRNIDRIPDAQRRFDALGIRPTYFTTYQVCIAEKAAATMREVAAAENVEIGAHLHPWNTPPLLADVESMLLNVPPQQQKQKLETLSAELRRAIQVRPRSFRAGRFGLGQTTVRCLIDLGYDIDSSVTPFFSWEAFDHGPSHVGAPNDLYRLDGHGDVRTPATGPLVEAPISSGFNRWHPGAWLDLHTRLNRPLSRALRLRGASSRSGFARPVILSPESHTARDLEGLSLSLLAGNAPYLHMFWHSPSLMPGLSPFCRSQRDVDELWRRVETYMESMGRHCTLIPMTLSEAVDRLAPAPGPATELAAASRESFNASASPVTGPARVAGDSITDSVGPELAVAQAESPQAQPSPEAQVGKHTAIYLAGTLLSRAVSFFMLPFYTHYLTPADYGIMQLLDMTLDVISIMAGTRIASGIHRYYFKATTDDERRQVLSTAIGLLGVSFIMFGLLTVALARPLTEAILGSDEHVDLMMISAAGFALQALIIVPGAILQMRKRSALITSINTVKLVIQLSLNILFLSVFKIGVKGVFISTLIANIVTGLWMTSAVLPRIGFRISPVIARRLLTYGLPLVATQFATFFVTYGDRYFLRVAGDLTEVGLYSLAYQFGFIVVTVGYVPFSMVWEPTRFQVAERPDRDRIYSNAFMFVNLFLCTACVGTALLVRDFIIVMSDEAYHSAYQIVPVILLAYVLQSWAYFHEAGILIREKTHYVTLANWVSAATAFVGYALLVPRYLGWGAALATVLAFAVREIITYGAAQLLLPIRFRWGPVWRVVGLAAATTVAGIFAPHPNIPISLLIRGGLFAVYCILVWQFGGIDDEHKERVRQAVRSPQAFRAFLSRG